jgi:hypothetical protein
MILAFLNGLMDGLRQPWDLTVGMTYDDDPESSRSRAYDHGANAGQRIGRRFR